MGFEREGNRRSASKGHELKLIASMKHTGRVYRVYSPVIGSWLVPVNSRTEQDARRRDGWEIEEVTDTTKLNAELRYLDYDSDLESALDTISASEFVLGDLE